MRDGPVSAPATGDLRRHRGAPAALDPLLVAVLAAAVSMAGAARPSFWYDEAATISAAYSRSLAQMWHMLGNVDAVLDGDIQPFIDAFLLDKQKKA